MREELILNYDDMFVPSHSHENINWEGWRLFTKTVNMYKTVLIIIVHISKHLKGHLAPYMHYIAFIDQRFLDKKRLVFGGKMDKTIVIFCQRCNQKLKFCPWQWY